MQIKVTTEYSPGAQQLRDGTLISSINNAVAAGISEAGRELLAEAEATAPKDTGELAASHQITGAPTPGNATLTVEALAEHAIYVHEGTSSMPPRPWLRNAAEKTDASAACEKHLNIVFSQLT